MASKMNVSLSYNADQRQKDIINGLNKDFDPKIIEQILINSSVKPCEGLTHIEFKIEELERNVRSISGDGTAHKYLLFEDQSRKLLNKLDDILLDTDSDRQRRRDDIQRLVNCSVLLKKSSIENLHKLLIHVKSLDIHTIYEAAYLDAEKLISRSSGCTITQVDDHRFKLENIKQKITMQ